MRVRLSAEGLLRRDAAGAPRPPLHDDFAPGPPAAAREEGPHAEGNRYNSFLHPLKIGGGIGTRKRRHIGVAASMMAAAAAAGRRGGAAGPTAQLWKRR